MEDGAENVVVAKLIGDTIIVAGHGARKGDIVCGGTGKKHDVGEKKLRKRVTMNERFSQN
jgi:hypothetical protein